MAIEMLSADEYGRIYATDKLLEMITDFDSLAVWLDENHDIYLLCNHPLTNELAYHSIIELLNPEVVPDLKVTPFKRKLYNEAAIVNDPTSV